MQVYNLFKDRFCLRPLVVWRANGQDNSHRETTKNYWSRTSNLSKSGWIVTKQATHLKMVGLWPTDQTIDQTIGRI